MIAYLKGIVKLIKINWIILETKDGVGYKINIKAQMSNIKIGDIEEFYTYHHIREDISQLYGFETMEELEMFELLLSVNGVGPKMAMTVLSRTSLEKLKDAVSKGDISLLTAISRLGKKLASKIIIELKSKLGSDSDIDIGEGSQEVIDALESLGYKKSEIVGVLSKIPNDLKKTEERVKWVLKNSKK